MKRLIQKDMRRGRFADRIGLLLLITLLLVLVASVLQGVSSLGGVLS